MDDGVFDGLAGGGVFEEDVDGAGGFLIRSFGRAGEVEAGEEGDEKGGDEEGSETAGAGPARRGRR